MLKKLKKIGVILILIGLTTAALLFVTLLPAQTGNPVVLQLVTALAERSIEPMPEKKVRDKYSEAGPEILLQYSSV